jgi:hypothetical protein
VARRAVGRVPGSVTPDGAVGTRKAGGRRCPRLLRRDERAGDAQDAALLQADTDDLHPEG